MINKPRGTQDIVGYKALIHQKIKLKAIEILNSSGYQQIITPAYEKEELFLRSLGTDTDIVSKEMFSFEDRKLRRLVLRPESTASIVRAVCQNNMLRDSNPLKLYYWANMFRYERPQKGRYREFWQLGIELVNCQGVYADFELICLAKLLLDKFNIRSFVFNINYLGCENTKEEYRKLLLFTLKERKSELCEDCQNRYYSNPLRIMDCELCGLLNNLPPYSKVLSNDEINYLKILSELLSASGVDFIINEKLVRGLDYYSGIVFEVKLDDYHKSILGGGRYDNLFEKIGNLPIKAAGFALGIDRLVDFISLSGNFSNKSPDLLIISLVDQAFPISFSIRRKLLDINQSDILIECNLELRDKSKLFKLINIYNPKFVIFIGEKEMAGNFFTVKNTLTKQMFKIESENLIDWAIEKLSLN